MIRKPLQTVYSNNVTGTASSSIIFAIAPYDVTSLVCKLTGTALTGASISMWLQTTDDGGTTFFDLARFPDTLGFGNSASAQWAVIPLDGGGNGKAVGSALAKTLTSSANTAASVSGLPILSNTFKLVYDYTAGAATTASWVFTIYANTQDGSGY